MNAVVRLVRDDYRRGQDCCAEQYERYWLGHERNGTDRELGLLDVGHCWLDDRLCGRLKFM